MSSASVAAGFLVIASPDLADPNFFQTVVLIIRHDEHGSFGLVLNRPAERRLGEILPEVDPRAQDVPVFQGGPVQTEMVQFVGARAGHGNEVIDGVTVGAALDELLEGGGDRVRAYAGYAGWGAGQLQRETEEGSWIIAPASARHVFDTPSERLWSTTLKELGGNYAWMALKRSKPSEN